MYKITFLHKDEDIERDLYTPGDNDYCLTSAKLNVACGASGELDISIPDDNPARHEIECLTDEVIVYRNEKEIWRGRPVTLQIDFNLTGSLTCEGILSYLYDTYYEPFEFEGSPNDLLKDIIDNHNSKVEKRKQFAIGEITVEDPNDYINRSSIYYSRTLEVLEEKFIKDSLGGYFRVRVEGDTRYLDYLVAYNTQSNQPVEYGYNLLDIAQDVQYSDVASVILPLGAKLQDEDGLDTDDRLTIASVNGGDIYLQDPQAVETYGWIVVEVEWDDVTLADNLYSKAQEYLEQVTSPISRFTIKAVDLSLADPELDPINLGDFVLIRVDSHGVNQYVELTSMNIDILNPVNSTLQFGTDAATLTGSTNNTSRSIQESMGSLSMRLTNLSTNVLNAVYANIETIVAGTITTDFIQAAVADLGYVTADWVEANTINVDYLEANYASIYDMDVMFEYVVSLEAEIAGIGDLFADYATIQDLTAALATIGDLYVGKEEVAELLAGYATIEQLYAVSIDVDSLNADVADIVSLLAGEAGVGILETIHLTVNNAVIDEAVITEALIGTVLADIIQSNVIYTDYITIMSLDGNYINTGSMEQFSDSNGTVRIQIGLDASGNYNFYIADEDGNLLWDALGLTEAGLTANGAIIKDAAIADDANIAASKLDIADLTQTLNENGELILTAEQITIGGGTLDYAITEIQQSIENLEALDGIEYVEIWYALSTNPDYYPPLDADADGTSAVLGVGILGQMILGASSTNWTTDRLVAQDGQYLWFVHKLYHTDGTTSWTTPTLVTDDYIRTTVTTTQTELEVVQGQIQAKIWQTDIDTAVNSLNDEISTISDQYALLTITINQIDERVGSLTTTVDQYYTELSSQVASLTLTIDGITAQVREVEEKTANAITEGVPYYAVSTNPDFYPPHDATDSTAVLGKGILGRMVLGVSESNWTTDQPTAGEGEYVWICYLRTRVDGTTYWTEPTLLTDEWARLSYSEMSEKYSQLVLEVDSALLEVVAVHDLLTSEYSTTSETRAAIEMAVEDSEASILVIVSNLETTVTAEITTVSDRVSEISTDLDGITARVQDVETSTKNALVDGVPYYATSSNPDYYPSHDYADDETSVLGRGVLGKMVLGASNTAWTTEQPKYQEGQYIWISYLRTRLDGTTYWTEPTLLTDDYLREATTEISNRYSQLVLEIDSALLEVYNLQQTLADSYTTTAEMHAYIQEVVDDESATILEEVSGKYATYDTLKGYYTISETDAKITASAESTSSTILSQVSETYATNSDLKGVSDLADYLNDNSVANVETYYTVSNNASSANSEQNKETIGEGDFTGSSLPTGWSAGYYASPNSAEFYDSPTLGRCYKILRAGSNVPYVRETVAYKEGYCKAEFTVATEEGYEDHAVVRHGRQGLYVKTEEGQIRSDKWTTIEAVYNMSSALSTYFYIYNYSDYEYSVPLLLKDVKVYTIDYADAEWSTDYPENLPSGSYLWVRYLITYTDGHTEWTEPFCGSAIGLSSEISQNTATIKQYVDSEMASIDLQVENGVLGKTASIVMTAGSSTITQEIDMEDVRQAFADDTTAVVIKAGTVEFDTGTLIINGGNLTLDSSGNATFSGNLKSPTGNIGGWYIDEYNLYNTDEKNGIVYLSPSMILLGASNVTVDSSGNVTSQDAQFSVDRYGFMYSVSGYIGGWSIENDALYDNCTSIDDDTVGTYLGPDGIRINTKSSVILKSDSFIWSSGSLNEYGSYTAETQDGSTYYPEVSITSSSLQLHAYGYVYSKCPIGGMIINYSAIHVYDSSGNDWFYVDNLIGHEAFYVEGEKITASDESIKNNIKPIDDTTYDNVNLFDSLQVDTFQYKSDKSKKTHVGLTYQNVVSALEKAGIDPDTSAMVGYVEDEDGNKKYGIEYDDIVALLVYEVQQLKKQISSLTA